jgi:FkbM family methyltransferase
MSIMSVDEPVIYDFGMNNGDDVEYYLLKCRRIVGVEANEQLCTEVRRRFAREIEEGRLSVVNAALSEVDGGGPMTFYIHRQNHLLSQLPRPSADQIDQFDAVEVPCRTAASIIEEFGPPRYVKVDVEHFDQVVLKDLFSAGIYPPEISAEAHSIEVFAHLVASGYNSFSLVDGKTVVSKYADSPIRTLNGPRRFSFKYHSAGPFGEDIQGRWEDRETFFHTLADAGLGWKDIHASRLISPEAPASNWTLAGRRLLSLGRKVGAAIKWRTLDRISGER